MWAAKVLVTLSIPLSTTVNSPVLDDSAMENSTQKASMKTAAALKVTTAEEQHACPYCYVILQPLQLAGPRKPVRKIAKTG
ncbi:hypothetical protein F441_02337 [Phytophthora nicotianae CJ01A1]|uniref:Secreted protein n=6 Tax=Phytophthora nicotianae TaxID=4792 RepID=W2QPU2_PHYN3|nr:hypothetical protein PPTG_22042 [Phytophthora nicotianae INRA-310]ETI54917.1 hypothetical protein F443_02370 [Phytophthora nicotianae P1569]ETK94738.1 hypothetical protein L915_02270 [Phytophthora nicotianae]ETO83651.1 hypothetical protein F444_02366 [Phytophthora nicotianae P1976]ETP24713.1 hypothetical protein F441_02337 [Phytophthora nicotianae CJ01A1]ETP52687.1 hypothetical protein F442_02339 [Phytophthora nicotianae P10297]